MQTSKSAENEGEKVPERSCPIDLLPPDNDQMVIDPLESGELEKLEIQELQEISNSAPYDDDFLWKLTEDGNLEDTTGNSGDGDHGIKLFDLDSEVGKLKPMRASSERKRLLQMKSVPMSNNSGKFEVGKLKPMRASSERKQLLQMKSVPMSNNSGKSGIKRRAGHNNFGKFGIKRKAGHNNSKKYGITRRAGDKVILEITDPSKLDSPMFVAVPPGLPVGHYDIKTHSEPGFVELRFPDCNRPPLKLRLQSKKDIGVKKKIESNENNAKSGDVGKLHCPVTKEQTLSASNVNHQNNNTTVDKSSISVSQSLSVSSHQSLRPLTGDSPLQKAVAKTYVKKSAPIGDNMVTVKTMASQESQSMNVSAALTTNLDLQTTLEPLPSVALRNPLDIMSKKVLPAKINASPVSKDIKKKCSPAEVNASSTMSKTRDTSTFGANHAQEPQHSKQTSPGKSGAELLPCHDDKVKKGPTDLKHKEAIEKIMQDINSGWGDWHLLPPNEEDTNLPKSSGQMGLSRWRVKQNQTGEVSLQISHPRLQHMSQHHGSKAEFQWGGAVHLLDAISIPSNPQNQKVASRNQVALLPSHICVPQLVEVPEPSIMVNVQTEASCVPQDKSKEKAPTCQSAATTEGPAQETRSCKTESALNQPIDFERVETWGNDYWKLKVTPVSISEQYIGAVNKKLPPRHKERNIHDVRKSQRMVTAVGVSRIDEEINCSHLMDRDFEEELDVLALDDELNGLTVHDKYMTIEGEDKDSDLDSDCYDDEEGETTEELSKSLEDINSDTNLGTYQPEDLQWELVEDIPDLVRKAQESTQREDKEVSFDEDNDNRLGCVAQLGHDIATHNIVIEPKVEVDDATETKAFYDIQLNSEDDVATETEGCHCVGPVDVKEEPSCFQKETAASWKTSLSFSAATIEQRLIPTASVLDSHGEIGPSKNSLETEIDTLTQTASGLGTHEETGPSKISLKPEIDTLTQTASGLGSHGEIGPSKNSLKPEIDALTETASVLGSHGETEPSKHSLKPEIDTLTQTASGLGSHEETGPSKISLKPEIDTLTQTASGLGSHEETGPSKISLKPEIDTLTQTASVLSSHEETGPSQNSLETEIDTLTQTASGLGSHGETGPSKNSLEPEIDALTQTASGLGTHEETGPSKNSLETEIASGLGTHEETGPSKNSVKLEIDALTEIASGLGSREETGPNKNSLKPEIDTLTQTEERPESPVVELIPLSDSKELEEDVEEDARRRLQQRQSSWRRMLVAQEEGKEKRRKVLDTMLTQFTPQRLARKLLERTPSYTTQHMEDIDSKPTLYGCYFCSFSSSSDCNVAVHWTLDHLKEKPYVCKYCPQDFSRSGDAYNHMSEAHSKKRRVICLKPSTRYKNMVTMDMVNPNTTGLCSGLADTNPSEEHQWATYIYACQLCEAVAYRIVDIRSHVRKKHLNVKPYRCLYCTTCCRSENLMTNHIKRKHRNKPVRYRIDSELVGVLRTVKMSDFYQVVPAGLKDYLVPEGPYWDVKEAETGTKHTCRLCGTEAASPDAIWKHVVIEHKLPWGCYCTSCTVYHKLSQPERSEGFMLCHRCNHLQNICLISNNKGRSLHIQKFYTCRECLVLAKLPRSMEDHIKAKHLKDLPYRCHHCSFDSAFKDEVRYHMLRQHPTLPQIEAKVIGSSLLNMSKNIRELYRTEWAVINSADTTCLAKYTIVNSERVWFMKDCNCVDAHTSIRDRSVLVEKETGDTSTQSATADGWTFKLVSRSEEINEIPTKKVNQKLSSLENRQKFAPGKLQDFKGKVHFVCNMCSYRCIDRSCMARHVKYKHLRIHPHTCPHCHYSNVEKTKVKLHIQNVHPELHQRVDTNPLMVAAVGEESKRHFVHVNKQGVAKDLEEETLPRLYHVEGECEPVDDVPRLGRPPAQKHGLDEGSPPHNPSPGLVQQLSVRLLQSVDEGSPPIIPIPGVGPVQQLTIRFPQSAEEGSPLKHNPSTKLTIRSPKSVITRPRDAHTDRPLRPAIPPTRKHQDTDPMTTAASKPLDDDEHHLVGDRRNMLARKQASAFLRRLNRPAVPKVSVENRAGLAPGLQVKAVDGTASAVENRAGLAPGLLVKAVDGTASAVENRAGLAPGLLVKAVDGTASAVENRAGLAPGLLVKAVGGTASAVENRAGLAPGLLVKAVGGTASAEVDIKEEPTDRCTQGSSGRAGAAYLVQTNKVPVNDPVNISHSPPGSSSGTSVLKRPHSTALYDFLKTCREMSSEMRSAPSSTPSSAPPSKRRRIWSQGPLVDPKLLLDPKLTDLDPVVRLQDIVAALLSGY